MLSVIEKLRRPIKAAFFVAGFAGFLGNKEFDDLNKTFVDKDFDWAKIRLNCGSFFIVNSDDDPYVPLDKGKELADKLGVDFSVLESAGHINAEAGYTSFPLLLDKIKKEL